MLSPLIAIRRVYRLSKLLGLLQTAKFLCAYATGFPLIQIYVLKTSFPLYCRPRSSDPFVLQQVFGVCECQMNFARPPQLIIDAGANVGYTTAFFASQFPEAKIIAIEPEPQNYHLLEQNTKNFPNVIRVAAGLWTKSTSLRIEDEQVESWAFKVIECEPNTPGSIPAVTIGNLMKSVGCDDIDLLKMDIEGAEEFIFSSETESWLPLTRNILVEVHSESAMSAIKNAAASDFLFSQQGEKVILQNKGTAKL